MKQSKEKSEPQQVYKGWNNCGFDGYIIASSLDEARKIVLSQTSVSRCKAMIFDVKPVDNLFLTEIE